MTKEPGSRPDAGASARQIADLARAAERRAQHRRARDTLPLTVPLAAVSGSGSASYTNWQIGLATALTLVTFDIGRLRPLRTCGFCLRWSSCGRPGCSSFTRSTGPCAGVRRRISRRA